MFRLLIFGLALYAVYSLFLKDKIIIIAPKKDRKNDKDSFNDYEEIR